MNLRISQEEFDKLQAHAEEGYPHEVVGILAGSRNQAEVSHVHPLINERAETRNRYRVDGLILMKAERQLEAAGLEIIGYYHSHPDHPAQYSDYDRDHALPNMSYVICSVLEGRADKTLSWILQEDRSSMIPQLIAIES
ncbi:MAG: M67 family metallopeptidase [Myxococcota bacterium]|nr:M67 family metallopeptidase [Myxococcota bacterium]